jgi:hypothetical protein
MGKFHLVIVNKFLDSFAEVVKADKVAGAEKLAEDAFAAKCKSSKGGKDKTLAHFKLFANPLDADAYRGKIKTVQEGVATHKSEKKAGSADEWAETQIANLK